MTNTKHHKPVITKVSSSSSGTRQPAALNPAFDHRMNFTGHFGLPIEKGFLVSDPVRNTSGYGRINYLFNPEQLSLSYTVNQNYYGGNAAIPDQTAAMGSIIGLSGFLQYSLYFDRTYEVWSKGTRSNGVLDDVAAFYYVCGISAATTKGKGKHVQNTGSYDAPVRPMAVSYAWFYFGAKMVIYGSIQSMNVTYTAFTRDLTPYRCQVDLTIQAATPNRSSVKELGLSQGSHTAFASVPTVRK